MSINQVGTACLTRARPAVADEGDPGTPALPPRRPGPWGVGLDWAERLLVAAFFGWLTARLIISYQASREGSLLLLIASEGLAVFFMLIRRHTNNVSRHAGEWLLALAAACAPLLVSPGAGYALVPAGVGAVVLLMGILMQLHAKLTLGRSFGLVPADRGVKVAGPYRFVRHPMYAGYLLSHLAFLAMNPTAWNLLVYALAYGLQVPRLLAEERLLSRDPRYGAYRSAVRYRLIPGVF